MRDHDDLRSARHPVNRADARVAASFGSSNLVPGPNRSCRRGLVPTRSRSCGRERPEPGSCPSHLLGALRQGTPSYLGHTCSRIFETRSRPTTLGMDIVAPQAGLYDPIGITPRSSRWKGHRVFRNRDNLWPERDRRPECAGKMSAKAKTSRTLGDSRWEADAAPGSAAAD